ncbi:hypothetical protein [Actinoplanes derwentensis]|uniref:Mce-associated membrane protein n=1 Tax=Actinoplanes derwentensis TaxID=113562 RepID=A0A1H2CYI9_9ACTN|nr:hypothetical protein [Actinoplanes derwentensis]SDT75369.1 hypothetical protein SAMN04489716_7280 [Actinoplanes derwentensis]
MTTPEPSGPAPRRGRLQNRRVRLVLALGGGVLALLCLGGVGLFVSLYDKATEIKRTEPDAVVDSFIRAYLVDRDENQVALYACERGADFTEIAAFRTDLIEREAKYSVTIKVTSGRLSVSTAGDQGAVQVDLTRSIDDSEHLTDSWTFRVVDQDGWRVCGATKS